MKARGLARRTAATDCTGCLVRCGAAQNLGDLSGWDPHSGTQPPLQTGNLLARMLKRNKASSNETEGGCSTNL